MHAMHETPVWVKLSPAIVMLVGLALAWNSYIRNPGIPAAFVAQFSGLYRFLMHKWYFDELYDALFVRPAFALGRFFWKRGDEGPIDQIGRASWRERVCQYVEILVVAGSVTNKKTTYKLAVNTNTNN